MARTYLSAAEAARDLGVTLPTLYAYVSRGLVRSERVGQARARRYHAADVVALTERRRVRRDPAHVAEVALHFGLPVLDSALSLITETSLFYRGVDAVALATSATIEEVAALLWTGTRAAVLPDGPAAVLGWDPLPRPGDRLRPIQAFQAILPLAAARDAAAYDHRPAAVVRAGAGVLRLLAAVATRRRPTAPGGVATLLQQAWAPGVRDARRLFQAALVLSADHELNVSTFTARCVASARATPYAVVAAGLAALEGTRHGGLSERVESFLEEAGSPRQVRTVIATRLRAGEHIPGFGHPLYPEGDPRARCLLDLMTMARLRTPAISLARALIDEVRGLAGLEPNIDFAIATLCRALELPSGTALALFALGRTVGWIAHAIEQYADPRLIRPRARYTGVPPA